MIITIKTFVYFEFTARIEPVSLSHQQGRIQAFPKRGLERLNLRQCPGKFPAIDCKKLDPLFPEQ